MLEKHIEVCNYEECEKINMQFNGYVYGIETKDGLGWWTDCEIGK